MENEGEFIERRLDEIFDEKPEKPEPQKIRHAVCTRCGAAFETTRPSAKLCQACRSAAKRANALKGGLEKHRAAQEEGSHLISPAAEAPGQLPLKGKPLETSAAPQEEAAPEATPEKGKVLTLGLLRRLLDEVDDSAVITIDGQPVTTFYVEHYYDLEDGRDTLRVDFGC